MQLEKAGISRILFLSQISSVQFSCYELDKTLFVIQQTNKS